MYSNINKSLFLLIGWLFRVSYQLECLRCTSAMRRSPTSWDHSCLDGTLKPLACPKTYNESEDYYHQCISAVYRFGATGTSGVMINRDCMYGPLVKDDCDPPEAHLNFDKSDTFFCRYPCVENGCNRQVFWDILANTSELSSRLNACLFITCIYFLFLSHSKFNSSSR